MTAGESHAGRSFPIDSHIWAKELRPAEAK
jgi:hypothetical protein